MESLEQALTTAEEVGLSGSEVEEGRELLWRLRGEVQVRYHAINISNFMCNFCCERVYAEVERHSKIDNVDMCKCLCIRIYVM